MSGFGSQPFGASPYGIGTPATAPAQGGKILRDTSNGFSTGSRKIDPLTKDYVLDDYGRLVGMGDLHQLVFLAVSTTKGSSAMRSLGQDLRRIERISSNFQRRVDTTLRAALQSLVNARRIEVISTSVEIIRPGVVRTRLRWRDLETGRENEIPIGGDAAASLSPSGGPPLQDRSLRTEDGEMLLAEDGDTLTY